MLDPMCFVTIALFFEIHNSEMYGGPGSVGYSSVTFEGVDRPDNANDEFVLAQRKMTARMLEVSVEDVITITKEAYDAATEDPDDDAEDDDWDAPDDEDWDE